MRNNGTKEIWKNCKQLTKGSPNTEVVPAMFTAGVLYHQYAAISIDPFYEPINRKISCLVPHNTSQKSPIANCSITLWTLQWSPRSGSELSLHRSPMRQILPQLLITSLSPQCHHSYSLFANTFIWHSTHSCDVAFLTLCLYVISVTSSASSGWAIQLRYSIPLAIYAVFQCLCACHID